MLPYEAYHFYGDTRPAPSRSPPCLSTSRHAPYWIEAYTANIDSTKHYLVSSGLGDWAARPAARHRRRAARRHSDNDQAVRDNTNFRVDTIGVPSGSAYMAYMVS